MKVKFTINIPNWLYRYRWKNISSYVKYHWSPSRCIDCNVKMPFGHFDIWSAKPSLGISYTKCVCPSCLAKRVDAISIKPNFVSVQRSADTYNVQHKCDICGSKSMGFKAFKMDDSYSYMRFCSGSWNSSYVCVPCIKRGLAKGEMRSSIYGQYKGRSTPLNQYGLPVVNGKVKFPDK